MPEDSQVRRAKPLFVAHPVLLAVCPVLGLYAYNVSTLDPRVMVRPALVAGAFASVFWLSLWPVLRDRYRAGMLASLLILAFSLGWGALEATIAMVIPWLPLPPVVYYAIFVAGMLAVFGLVILRDKRHRHSRIKALIFLGGAAIILATAGSLLSPVFGRRASWMISGYIMVVIAASVALLRARRDYRSMTRFANWFGAVLVALYLAMIAYNQSDAPRPKLEPIELEEPNPIAAETFTSKPYPDIYFIALDGYPRPDFLEKRYAYNTLPFIEAMEAMYFTKGKNSVSNYLSPEFSLTACLNMQYFDNLISPEDRASADLSTLAHLYHNNRAYDFLRRQGYDIFAFSPGLQMLEPRGNVDRVLSPEGALDEFEVVLLKQTAAARAMQMIYYFRYGNPAYWQFEYLRERVVYTFEELEALAAEKHESPRFIYAFLPVPSAPFLFERNGERALPFGKGSLPNDQQFRGDAEEFRQAFVAQLHYTNNELIEVSRRILEQEDHDPIIIIVSATGNKYDMAPNTEHGVTVEEPYANLMLSHYPAYKEFVEYIRWTRPLANPSMVGLLRGTMFSAFRLHLWGLTHDNYASNPDQPFVFQPVARETSPY